MAKRAFSVAVAGKDHFVEVKWGRLSNAGQISVNGKVVKAWGSGWWVPREVEFEIEGQKAILVRKDIISENFDLVVGGKKLE